MGKRKAPKRSGMFGDERDDQGAFDDIHSDTKSRDEAVRIERARELAHEADEWVTAHKDVWRFATDLCLNEARAKRRVSMQYASEVIRKKDFASFKRYGSGINNRLRPALARRLVREHPEVAPFIELRKSALDLIGEVGADA